MTKIDIISGFLGAGKTTLIRKLIAEVYAGQKIVLIENEFGEISVDGGFLKDSGVEIKEMNSGCICCSLSGDFKTSMNEVIDRFTPDRILIEPSGVGKLSDVMAAVESLEEGKAELNLCLTVVDAKKAKLYTKNFGEFFDNQVEHATIVLLSRTKDLEEEKINEAVALLRKLNAEAAIITTDWDALDGAEIMKAGLGSKERITELLKDREHHHDYGHCHEGHDHDHDHCHEGHDLNHGHCHEGHDHDHDHCHEGHDLNHGQCHEGHDHDHDHCHEGHDLNHGHCHEDHDHDHGSCCSHDHHHHHHADEVFDSIAFEGAVKLDRESLNSFLKILSEDGDYGMILRAKGIVEATEGGWWHFDMVPGEYEVRNGSASYTGVVCVIGSGLNKDKIKSLVEKELHIG